MMMIVPSWDPQEVVLSQFLAEQAPTGHVTVRVRVIAAFLIADGGDLARLELAASGFARSGGRT